MSEVFVKATTLLLTYGALVAALESKIPTNQTIINNQWYQQKLSLFNGDPSDPWYQQALPLEPRPGFYVYTKKCLDGLGDRHCVHQVFDEMFYRGEADASCCCRVKQIGRMCMVSVAGTIAHMDKFKPNAQHIYDRAHLISVRCAELPSCPPIL